MNKLIALTGIALSFAASVVTFYGIFFWFAPFVTGLIPACSWHGFLAMIVYVIIGWFGGLAIPILILWVGVLGAFALAGLSSFATYPDYSKREAKRDRARRARLIQYGLHIQA